jgi:MerR family copper efflux transcriptional regulator
MLPRNFKGEGGSKAMEYARKALAEKLGLSTETLRYYESAGVITPPRRDKNGYRVYSEENECEIGHFLQARKYGFTPKEVLALLERSKREQLTKEDILDIARGKIVALERRMRAGHAQARPVDPRSHGCDGQRRMGPR